jgi:large subunit ribosomal protein L25
LQAEGDNRHLNLHVDEVEFLTTRRQHVHLYDLDIDGTIESAVVRELQWNALGTGINHIEFKRVQRGVETESEVDLAFRGMIASGVLTHSTTHVTIRSLPSLIPDAIVVNVEGLSEGAHVTAADLVLPEGVSLVDDLDTDICHVSAHRVEVEKSDEDELEGGLEAPTAVPEPE